MCKIRQIGVMQSMWRLWSVLYVLLVGYVVFFAGRRPAFGWNPNNAKLRLTPFTTKWFLYSHGYDVSSLYLDILGNIVMFVPYALFLFMVFHVRNYLLIIASAMLFSIAIETIQYFTSVGFADIDDVIFNTLGAVLGVIIIDGVRMVEKQKLNT